MNAITLNNIALPTFGLPRVALPLSEVSRGSGGNVYFVDILDDEVIRVLNEHGMSRSPLGLTTDETGQIESFQDWFVGNDVVRFVNLSQFPNIADADLSGTFASVEFGTSLDGEYGISSLMLDEDDPNEEVSKQEIDAYLATLK